MVFSIIAYTLQSLPLFKIKMSWQVSSGCVKFKIKPEYTLIFLFVQAILELKIILYFVWNITVTSLVTMRVP